MLVVEVGANKSSNFFPLFLILSGNDMIANKIKKGKNHIAPINPLPLLPSGPGGVQGDLVV